MKVKTRCMRVAPVISLTPPGHGDNRYGLAPRVLPQAAAYFVAVHLRHPDVKQHHVGPERCRHVKRCITIVSYLRVVAFESQQQSQNLG